ncbi:FAD-dependent oxidoreductase [Homoserinibacter gongjuensis]|uniref:FAD-dependent oxidoreductase n=1 Tax=Homoserinibacter gongjuensis TaxID=1162968 RepID=UPI0024E16EFB|nr:FAD-dependent oxidoreductase [Homoserinibacter gongjuensis]
MLIVGGGLGGVAAALGAARRGLRVLVTEETDWIGGQLTSQGFPRRASLDRAVRCDAQLSRGSRRHP